MIGIPCRDRSSPNAIPLSSVVPVTWTSGSVARWPELAIICKEGGGDKLYATYIMCDKENVSYRC